MGMATHIIDWTIGGTGNDSIQIEAYPIASHVGINPYARLIIYPASANPIVRTDVGTAIRVTTVSNLIAHEAISFSGKTANAKFRIDILTAIEGFFFDSDNSHITPGFSVKNGILEASQEVWGAGFVSYYTVGVVYEYNADIVGFTTTIGTVFAFHPAKKGIAASYEIPTAEWQKSNREDCIVIYREVVIQGANTFEYPDNWDNSNNYANYPSASPDDKPVVGDSWAAGQENHHIVFVENGGLFDDLQNPFWYKPSTPIAFDGIVYKIKSSIPAEPTDTISADLIIRLQERELELKAQYGIA